jgi:hypothetical protein
MEKFNIENVLDQRKLVPHIVIIVFSIIITSLYISLSEGDKSFYSFIGGSIVGIIQIEMFIFLAHLIFGNLDPGITPAEITARVMSRFLLFLVLCLITAFLIVIGYNYLRNFMAGKAVSDVFSNFFRYSFSVWLKSTIVGLAIGTLIFIVVLWQDALKREQKLREENLIFQNETLRNQVNPHFLFNSLNTLSSLIDTQPETSKIFLSRLSAIYRYILDNSHRDKVTLKSELDFVSDYFDLHKIRDEEKIVLIIDVPDAEQFWILPVSLQILLENAIKHNMATRNNPLNIKIYLKDKNVIVSNNLQKMAIQMKSTKIGLRNLAERVILVTGKKLIIEETENDFTVKVPLI